MEINERLVAYLEDLSYLTLTEEEKRRLTGDLEKIVGDMARLNGLDTGDAPERSHPFDTVNVFRDDTARPSCDRALILQNAPERDEETFIAPRTVE